MAGQRASQKLHGRDPRLISNTGRKACGNRMTCDLGLAKFELIEMFD